MAFTNTVETVGDAALTRSIIDKSITELHCNLTTSIRQQAFRACSALASVNFPSVTSVALGAFWNCTALAKADFSSAVAFANNAFYGCSALTALILRNTEQISTISGTPFASSAIASGTGYIYVPAALVDTYKAASGWNTYAAQIRAIEDYLGVADAYTWAGVAANIADGSYKSVYKVGDLVPLDLGSEGLVNMQIAAFDADDLADGSGKAPISWISKELLNTKHRMNPERRTNDDGTCQEGTGSIGGWEKCEMRTYLNDTIKPLIPNNVQAMIKPVTKYSYIVDTALKGVNDCVTVDSVWIPSIRETNSDIVWETVGPVYNGLFDSYSKRRKKKLGDSSMSSWWLRSTDKGFGKYFGCIDDTGTLLTNAMHSSVYGIPLCFCT